MTANRLPGRAPHEPEVPPERDEPRDVDVVVVGGGQAALAAGYYLQREGRGVTEGPTCVLLDRSEEPGGAWNDGWNSLQLFSPAGYSSLPGWPMPPWAGAGNPTGEHVRRYLAAYEQRYHLPVRRPVRVTGVTVRPDAVDEGRGAQQVPAGGERFVVDTDHGRWTGRALISATGSWRRPFWPVFPGLRDFGGRQQHSADYRSAAALDGQAVLVVGGGNSGAQIAADLLLRGRAQVTWVTQRPPRFLPDDVDGRRLFELATARIRSTPVGAPDRVSAQPAGIAGLGDIVMVPPVLAARRAGTLRAQTLFDRLTPTGVAWDEPRRDLVVDTILWCTGFRPHLAHLRGLVLSRQNGLPVTRPDRPTQSVDHPGLFFLGYGDWCGLASATLIGVGASARAAVSAALTVSRESRARAG